jgi:heme/copper-type cytochrome/quinol oxidase subunit 2
VPSADPSTPPGPDPDGTARDQHLPVDAGALVERFRVEVRSGTVEPPRTDIRVPVGDTIELAVTTDVGAALRVVELGVSRDVPADEETIVAVTVKRAGRFEVTLDGVLIALVTAP